MSLPEISGYHAHVYFDADSLDQAIALCERARDEMGTTMGRVHQRPVGPHSGCSCQLAFATDRVAAMLPWLIFNRDGLTIFMHPETGDDLADHTKHVIWLGNSKPLNVDQFL